HPTLPPVPSVYVRPAGDPTCLCSVDVYQLVNTGGQIVVFVTVEDTNTNNGTGFTVWDLQRGITDFFGFFTEDGTQQTFFWGKFGFTLRGHTTNEDVTGFNLSTDVDDAAFVKLGQNFFRDVWNVAGDFFGTKFGVTSIDFVFFDVN